MPAPISDKYKEVQTLYEAFYLSHEHFVLAIDSGLYICPENDANTYKVLSKPRVFGTGLDIYEVLLCDKKGLPIWQRELAIRMLMIVGLNVTVDKHKDQVIENRNPKLSSFLVREQPHPAQHFSVKAHKDGEMVTVDSYEQKKMTFKCIALGENLITAKNYLTGDPEAGVSLTFEEALSRFQNFSKEVIHLQAAYELSGIVSTRWALDCLGFDGDHLIQVDTAGCRRYADDKDYQNAPLRTLDFGSIAMAIKPWIMDVYRVVPGGFEQYPQLKAVVDYLDVEANRKPPQLKDRYGAARGLDLGWERISGMPLIGLNYDPVVEIVVELRRVLKGEVPMDLQQLMEWSNGALKRLKDVGGEIDGHFDAIKGALNNKKDNLAYGPKAVFVEMADWVNNKTASKELNAKIRNKIRLETTLDRLQALPRDNHPHFPTNNLRPPNNRPELVRRASDQGSAALSQHAGPLIRATSSSNIFGDLGSHHRGVPN